MNDNEFDVETIRSVASIFVSLEEEYIKHLDEESGWVNNDYDYGVSCSYSISVKPEASDILGTEEIAELLNKIQNLFISNEYYG